MNKIILSLFLSLPFTSVGFSSSGAISSTIESFPITQSETPREMQIPAGTPTFPAVQAPQITNLELPSHSFGCTTMASEYEADEERMDVLRVINNEDFIRAFVSHPKMIEYFAKGREKIKDLMVAIRSDIENLGERFPSNPAAKEILPEYLIALDRVVNPLPKEEVVMPFLIWGVADSKGIEDSELLKQFQDFQVKLFQNFLARQGIRGCNWVSLKEVEEFLSNSSLPVFSPEIADFVRKARELDEDLDDIVDLYDEDEPLEEVSFEQRAELSGLDDSLSFFNRLTLDQEEGEEDDDEEEDDYTMNDLLEALEAFEEIIEGRNYDKPFSRDKIFKLFFEVMEETYPDEAKFFQEVQKADAS